MSVEASQQHLAWLHTHLSPSFVSVLVSKHEKQIKSQLPGKRVVMFLFTTLSKLRAFVTECIEKESLIDSDYQIDYQELSECSESVQIANSWKTANNTPNAILAIVGIVPLPNKIITLTQTVIAL